MVVAQGQFGTGVTPQAEGPQSVFVFRCHTQGVGKHVQEEEIWGYWTSQESQLHINILEISSIFSGCDKEQENHANFRKVQ